MADRPTEAGAPTFAPARRGYDRGQVDAFVRSVLVRIRELEDRGRGLAARLETQGGTGPEDLRHEFERVGAEVTNILESARRAAEEMRSQAAADAERWRTEGRAESEGEREEAQRVAESIRHDAWNTGTQLLEQARAEAERMRREGADDALLIRAQAEQEAHRLVISGRREIEEGARQSRVESDRLLSAARADADALIHSAMEEVETAEENTRALEARQAELRAELDRTMATITELEADLAARLASPPAEPQPATPPEADDAAPPRRVVADDEESTSVRLVGSRRWASQEDTIRIVRADSDHEPVDALEIAAELQRMRDVRTAPPAPPSPPPVAAPSPPVPPPAAEEPVAHAGSPAAVAAERAEPAAEPSPGVEGPEVVPAEPAAAAVAEPAEAAEVAPAEEEPALRPEPAAEVAPAEEEPALRPEPAGEVAPAEEEPALRPEPAAEVAPVEEEPAPRPEPAAEAPAAPEPAPVAADEDDVAAPAEPAAAPAAAGPAIDDLFARLRGDGGGEPPASRPPADEPPAAAAREAAPVRATTLSTEDPFELRDRLLLPVTNNSLREVKRVVLDLQNLVLEGLRTTGEGWAPDADAFADALRPVVLPLSGEAETAGRRAAAALSGGAEAEAGRPPPDPAPLLGSALADAISETLGRVEAAGEGPRQVTAAVSRVFRGWRSDEAERRLRSVAFGAYHDGLLAGLSAAGVDAVRGVPAGRTCAGCPAGTGMSWSPGAPPPPGTVVPPAELECACTIVPA